MKLSSQSHNTIFTKYVKIIYGITVCTYVYIYIYIYVCIYIYKYLYIHHEYIYIYIVKYTILMAMNGGIHH